MLSSGLLQSDSSYWFRIAEQGPKLHHPRIGPKFFVCGVENFLFWQFKLKFLKLGKTMIETWELTYHRCPSLGGACSIKGLQKKRKWLTPKTNSSLISFWKSPVRHDCGRGIRGTLTRSNALCQARSLTPGVSVLQVQWWPIICRCDVIITNQNDFSWNWPMKMTTSNWISGTNEII